MYKKKKYQNTLEHGLVENKYTLDTGCQLNVHKTFRKRPRLLLNVLCTFISVLFPRGISNLKTRNDCAQVLCIDKTKENLSSSI